MSVQSIADKLFETERDEFSNVIKDNRAKLGSMREKTDHTKKLCRQRGADEPTLSRLVSSAEPAQIDIIAFGKRLAEIIANQPASEPQLYQLK